MVIHQRDGTIPDRDGYGRIIAVCRKAAGQDLGRAMVLQGWALAYRRYSRRYVPA